MKTKLINCAVLFSAVVLFGCNDTTSNSETTTAVSENSANTTAGSQENHGPLATITELADVGVHGKVNSIETIYTNDERELPHTLVTLEIKELLFGDYEDFGSKEASFYFVGGKLKNGNILGASHNPVVSVGDEVVALIRERDNAPCTLAQCEKGLFHVVDGLVIADNESAVVVDKNHSVRFVKKAARKSGHYKSLLDKGSLQNFKGYIASLGKRASAKSKQIHLTKFDKTQPFAGSPALYTASVAPTTDEEHAKSVALAKAKHQMYLSTLTDRERWEYQAFEANGSSAVLPNSYRGEGQQ